MTSRSRDQHYARRQRMIEKHIAPKLGVSFGMRVYEPFPDVDRINDQVLAALPMWRVPFYVVAHRMRLLSDRRIIDHAWWLLADDGSNEPWGFVTEPYVEVTYAERLASLLRKQVDKWGIEIEVLPQSESAWLPNGTVPIVTTVKDGCLPQFLLGGVGAALNYLSA